MESKEASIYIGIFDTKNLRVEPPVLDLRTTYTFQVTIINRTTTSGGHPWQASFEVGLGISLDGIDILPYAISPPRDFAPDATIKYTHTVYIPREYAGMSGEVLVSVLDPFGKILAEATKPFSIGHAISPDAVYEVPGRILARGDMPYLNPDQEVTDGEVVMAGVGTRPPPRQPSPPKPKVAPVQGTKEEAPGIGCPTKPEPKVEFEGEMPVDGRIG